MLQPQDNHTLWICLVIFSENDSWCHVALDNHLVRWDALFFRWNCDKSKFHVWDASLPNFLTTLFLTNNYYIPIMWLYGVDIMLNLSSDHFSLKFLLLKSSKTCSFMSAWYSELLWQLGISALQECQCLQTTAFMQDGATPNIGCYVKDLLCANFGENYVIFRGFLDVWLHSPKLNAYDI